MPLLMCVGLKAFSPLIRLLTTANAIATKKNKTRRMTASTFNDLPATPVFLCVVRPPTIAFMVKIKQKKRLVPDHNVFAFREKIKVRELALWVTIVNATINSPKYCTTRFVAHLPVYYIHIEIDVLFNDT